MNSRPPGYGHGHAYEGGNMSKGRPPRAATQTARARTPNTGDVLQAYPASMASIVVGGEAVAAGSGFIVPIVLFVIVLGIMYYLYITFFDRFEFENPFNKYPFAGPFFAGLSDLFDLFSNILPEVTRETINFKLDIVPFTSDCYTGYTKDTNELIDAGITVYIKMKLEGDETFYEDCSNCYCFSNEKNMQYIERTERDGKYIYILLEKTDDDNVNDETPIRAQLIGHMRDIHSKTTITSTETVNSEAGITCQCNDINYGNYDISLSGNFEFTNRINIHKHRYTTSGQNQEKDWFTNTKDKTIYTFEISDSDDKKLNTDYNLSRSNTPKIMIGPPYLQQHNCIKDDEMYKLWDYRFSTKQLQDVNFYNGNPPEICSNDTIHIYVDTLEIQHTIIYLKNDMQDQVDLIFNNMYSDIDFDNSYYTRDDCTNDGDSDNHNNAYCVKYQRKNICITDPTSSSPHDGDYLNDVCYTANPDPTSDCPVEDNCIFKSNTMVIEKKVVDIIQNDADGTFNGSTCAVPAAYGLDTSILNGPVCFQIGDDFCSPTFESDLLGWHDFHCDYCDNDETSTENNPCGHGGICDANGNCSLQCNNSFGLSSYYCDTCSESSFYCIPKVRKCSDNTFPECKTNSDDSSPLEFQNKDCSEHGDTYSLYCGQDEVDINSLDLVMDNTCGTLSESQCNGVDSCYLEAGADTVTNNPCEVGYKCERTEGENNGICAILRMPTANFESNDICFPISGTPLMAIDTTTGLTMTENTETRHTCQSQNSDLYIPATGASPILQNVFTELFNSEPALNDYDPTKGLTYIKEKMGPYINTDYIQKCSAVYGQDRWNALYDASSKNILNENITNPGHQINEDNFGEQYCFLKLVESENNMIGEPVTETITACSFCRRNPYGTRTGTTRIGGDVGVDVVSGGGLCTQPNCSNSGDCNKDGSCHCFPSSYGNYCEDVANCNIIYSDNSRNGVLDEFARCDCSPAYSTDVNYLGYTSGQDNQMHGDLCDVNDSTLCNGHKPIFGSSGFPDDSTNTGIDLNFKDVEIIKHLSDTELDQIIATVEPYIREDAKSRFNPLEGTHWEMKNTGGRSDNDKYNWEWCEDGASCNSNPNLWDDLNSREKIKWIAISYKMATENNNESLFNSIFKNSSSFDSSDIQFGTLENAYCDCTRPFNSDSYDNNLSQVGAIFATIVPPSDEGNKVRVNNSLQRWKFIPDTPGDIKYSGAGAVGAGSGGTCDLTVNCHGGTAYNKMYSGDIGPIQVEGNVAIVSGADTATACANYNGEYIELPERGTTGKIQFKKIDPDGEEYTLKHVLAATRFPRWVIHKTGAASSYQVFTGGSEDTPPQNGYQVSCDPSAWHAASSLQINISKAFIQGDQTTPSPVYDKDYFYLQGTNTEYGTGSGSRVPTTKAEFNSAITERIDVSNEEPLCDCSSVPGIPKTGPHCDIDSDLAVHNGSIEKYLYTYHIDTGGNPENGLSFSEPYGTPDLFNEYLDDKIPVLSTTHCSGESQPDDIWDGIDPNYGVTVSGDNLDIYRTGGTKQCSLDSSICGDGTLKTLSDTGESYCDCNGHYAMKEDGSNGGVNCEKPCGGSSGLPRGGRQRENISTIEDARQCDCYAGWMKHPNMDWFAKDQGALSPNPAGGHHLLLSIFPGITHDQLFLPGTFTNRMLGSGGDGDGGYPEQSFLTDASSASDGFKFAHSQVNLNSGNDDISDACNYECTPSGQEPGSGGKWDNLWDGDLYNFDEHDLAATPTVQWNRFANFLCCPTDPEICQPSTTVADDGTIVGGILTDASLTNKQNLQGCGQFNQHTCA